jgi:hypothetical protein
MLHEAFGELSLSQTIGSELHSHFKASRMSVEDDELQDDQDKQNDSKCCKIQEIITKQSMSL